MAGKGETQPRSTAAGSAGTDTEAAGRPRRPALEAHRLVAAFVGLFLVMVPAVSSFYDGGRLDFSVQAIVVGAALGLPLTLLGFAASKEATGAPVSLYLLAHRAVTAALLVAAIVFALRDEPTAALLFAGAVIVLALILLKDANAGRDEKRHPEAATTVPDEG